MPARLRSVLLLALGLAVSAALALLADAVFAVGRDLGRPAATAAHPSGLRFELAESLLGAGGERDFREALRLFEETRAAGTSPEVALELHGEGEVRLAAAAEQSGDPARRARAANLKGILLYEDSWLDPPSARRFLELSLEAFRQAVALDPANADAKLNLELVAGYLRERQSRIDGESNGAGSSGAGSSPEGSGY